VPWGRQVLIQPSSTEDLLRVTCFSGECPPSSVLDPSSTEDLLRVTYFFGECPPPSVVGAVLTGGFTPRNMFFGRVPYIGCPRNSVDTEFRLFFYFRLFRIPCGIG
jgi:hypothetical protein